MIESIRCSAIPPARVCERAVVARDARFDGLFFVGITTTGIYCRPVCPTRRARSRNRRFFDSPAAAERAGYRPCLRCRPELAPGRAQMDAVPRLAEAAARRISSGGLNGRSVAQLAAEFGVSERHLRRALEREFGVSPVELAQTYRLLLAKRLLADTPLPVTRIAYASGFQSLRRFHSVFRERYRLSPTALRRSLRSNGPTTGPRRARGPWPHDSDDLRLTLAYRAPLGWDPLLRMLADAALSGVEVVQGARYARTVRIDGRKGVVLVENARRKAPEDIPRGVDGHLDVAISSSLLPALMPLLARLRQLFDLDAEPLVVDACLDRGGLGTLTRRHPGLRVPGAFDGFEVAFATIVRGRARPGAGPSALGACVVRTLGEPLETGFTGLTRLAPTPDHVVAAGVPDLVRLGLPALRASALVQVARLVSQGELRLEPGSDAAATYRRLTAIEGIGDRLATSIVMRALCWPDAFPARDPVLQRAAGASDPGQLREWAEKWRPWRAYAALHLWSKEGAS